MSYEVVFVAAAHEDLQLAFEWYENQRTGLGWKFRYEVAACVEIITNDLVSYQGFHGRNEKGSIIQIPLHHLLYLLY